MLRESLNNRIEKRLRRRRFFFLHAGFTVLLTLAVLWAVDVFNLPPKTQDIVIPAAVLLLIAHLLWSKYQDTNDAIIQQELRRERQYQQMEKPKRHLMVSDDGELSEVVEDDWDDRNEKAKNGE